MWNTYFYICGWDLLFILKISLCAYVYTNRLNIYRAPCWLALHCVLVDWLVCVSLCSEYNDAGDEKAPNIIMLAGFRTFKYIMLMLIPISIPYYPYNPAGKRNLFVVSSTPPLSADITHTPCWLNVCCRFSVSNWIASDLFVFILWAGCSGLGWVHKYAHS